MINNSRIRNVRHPFPILETLHTTETLGKVRLKNLYLNWNGENIEEIRAKHEKNPYTIRVGTPATDEKMKGDRIYFILHYLSFNPIDKKIEIRDLVTRRITEKLFIGQTTQEGEYKDYKMFVDGNIIADDIFSKKYPSLKDKPLAKLVLDLMNKVDKQTIEIQQLKAQIKNSPIYKKQHNQI